MKNLAAIKKYLPSIVYTILFIVGFFILYKLILRLRSGGLAIGGVAADIAENQTISTKTGIPKARIQELRTIASNVSIELETNKDLTWWWKTKHITFDSDVLEIMRNIKSQEEMIVVKNFYNNIFTNNRNLYNDLKDELSNSNLLQVPYIEALR